MDKAPDKKTCIRCKEEKDLKEFRKDESMKDNKSSVCRACAKERTNQNKLRRIEYGKQFFDAKTSAF
jgi:superfamily II helicase